LFSSAGDEKQEIGQRGDMAPMQCTADNSAY